MCVENRLYSQSLVLLECGDSYKDKSDTEHSYKDKLSLYLSRRISLYLSRRARDRYKDKSLSARRDSYYLSRRARDLYSYLVPFGTLQYYAPCGLLWCGGGKDWKGLTEYTEYGQ